MKKLFDIAELEVAIFGEEPSKEQAIGKIDDVWEEEEVFAEDFAPLEFELVLEGGQSLNYEVVGIFIAGNKEYVGLHPKNGEDGLFHIMELRQGMNDEIELYSIDNEDEYHEAVSVFYKEILDMDVEGNI